MIPALLGAVQFLTVLPVPGKTAPPARAAIFFPLVGAWLGWMGATIFLFLRVVFPAELAALAAVVFWVAVTGALHEDGLADVADAFRAGRPAERILAILKDSRIGSFGGVAIVLSVLFRWQGVGHIPESASVRLAAALAVSRGAMVALAWLARPAGAGIGAAFLQQLTTPVAVVAIAQSVAAAFLTGLRMGVVLLALNILVVLGARDYFHRRIGGVTGDCLGAVCQLSEICSLFLMTCQNCSW
jgi:adenosylcobinamide-GDP ribazoletransferase